MITTQKGFFGIDQRKTHEQTLKTATDMKNLRVCDSGSLKKRPTVSELYRFISDIDGLWSGMLFGKQTVAVANAGMLYIIDPNDESAFVNLVGYIGNGKCKMFEFNGALYIKSKGYYGKYNGTQVLSVEGYIPCVAISCAPNGEGTPFEQINLISDKRRQLFSSDGSSVLYMLAEDGIDSVVSVKVNGADYGKRYSLENGNSISFEVPPAKGLNNVEIVYSKPNSQTDKSRIMNCTDIMLFGGNSDGRAFLWGNEELPSYRFYSDLADGIPSVEYFPINAFTVIGNSKINCIVQQYDKQLIFTKNQAYYSYSELTRDSLGNTVTSFPVFSLNGSKGCVIESSGCVIDNRPVTLCDDGFNMWESTAVENERHAVCFSFAINEGLKALTQEEREKIKMFDFQAEREFYCVVGDNAFVFNYGNGAWYRFSGFQGDIFSVSGNKLYFANGNRLCVFWDGNERSDIICDYESPFLTNGHQNGDCDVVGLEADIFIKGELGLTFELEKSNGDKRVRRFYYHGETNRFHRISIRPILKNALPFRIRIKAEGEGEFSLHGITVKTRKKERRNKNGIL